MSASDPPFWYIGGPPLTTGPTGPTGPAPTGPVAPYYAPSAAEITLGIVPNTAYPLGTDLRYGAVGNGTTDDTVALSNFIKVANATPGLQSFLRNLTYAISQPLPTINTSNVQVYGAGVQRHDVTQAIAGTILKWIGAAGATMQTIAPVSGAGLEKIGGVVYQGIGFDCNQLANTALVMRSVYGAQIFIGTNEAALTAVVLGVVPTLGEGRDLQECNIRIIGNQIFETSATVLQCTGDSTANVSLNDFWLDLVHSNVRAVDLQGSDNNDWWSVRCFKVPAGTATESVAVEGGASSATCTRAERFHYFVANEPMHIYGTGSYAVAAHDIQVYLDKENGTPDLLIDAGATGYQQNSNTPVFDTPWVPYTPTVTASSGTFTTVSATGQYLERGKIAHFEAAVVCTTVGSAAGIMNVTLPAAEGNIGAWATQGYNTVAGTSCPGIIDQASSTVFVSRYDGAFPIASGQTVVVNGFYAISP